LARGRMEERARRKAIGRDPGDAAAIVPQEFPERDTVLRTRYATRKANDSDLAS